MDQKPFSFLIAEDDEDDYLLTLEALKVANVAPDIFRVKNGNELMEFLHSHSLEERPNPIGLIILDLNMPMKDGRGTLKELKSHPHFRKIPVIVRTTSQAESDISSSYGLGVNSFIKKPARFNDLVEIFKELSNYWFKTVTLPH
jgi:CheY-like chemotaxis protein